jgi:hypothetical protein
MVLMGSSRSRWGGPTQRSERVVDGRGSLTQGVVGLHLPGARRSVEARFVTSPPTDNCPQPKETLPAVSVEEDHHGVSSKQPVYARPVCGRWLRRLPLGHSRRGGGREGELRVLPLVLPGLFSARVFWSRWQSHERSGGTWRRRRAARRAGGRSSC